MSYDASYSGGGPGFPPPQLVEAAGPYAMAAAEPPESNDAVLHSSAAAYRLQRTEGRSDYALYVPTRSYQVLTRGAWLLSALLDGGRRFLWQQRQCVEMGEGPSVLRVLCFIGGLGMLISSILSLINILSLLTGPSTYVLQIYQGFFGIITMIVEAKDWDCFDQLKPWMSHWFRFLTVPAGKGAFYIFVGSLGVSLWIRNLLAFTVGLYMAGMGLSCIAVHAGIVGKKSTAVVASRRRFPTSERIDSTVRDDDEDDEEELDEELEEEDEGEPYDPRRAPTFYRGARDDDAATTTTSSFQKNTTK